MVKVRDIERLKKEIQENKDGKTLIVCDSEIDMISVVQSIQLDCEVYTPYRMVRFNSSNHKIKFILESKKLDNDKISFPIDVFVMDEELVTYTLEGRFTGFVYLGNEQIVFNHLVAILQKYTSMPFICAPNIKGGYYSIPDHGSSFDPGFDHSKKNVELDVLIKKLQKELSLKMDELETALSKNQGVGKEVSDHELISFGDAVKALKQGKRVSRKYWDGFWFISNSLRKDLGRIVIAKTKDDSYAPAQPYQEDWLADDWMIVNEK